MNNSEKKLYILIIDDEEDMCWALQRIIEYEGHNSLVATSAQDALRFVRKAAFDLAFVDVKLPDMDGLELVQHIRELSPELPCVLVSGYLYDDDEPVETGLASGLISGFIGKPFLLAQVRDAISGALVPR